MNFKKPIDINNITSTSTRYIKIYHQFEGLKGHHNREADEQCLLSEVPYLLLNLPFC